MNMQLQPQLPLLVLLALAVAALAVLAALQFFEHWPSLKHAFAGVKVPPELVGMTRGLALYFLPLAVGAAVVWVGGLRSPLLVPIVPTLIALLRLGESMIDARLKPAQNEQNPPPVAGGGSSDLLPE